MENDNYNKAANYYVFCKAWKVILFTHTKLVALNAISKYKKLLLNRKYYGIIRDN